jgi:hypothetical protein
MATMLETHEAAAARRAHPPIGWGLVIGGALFFVGGGMHPEQDPPDVTVKEHLHVMFEDSAWYPSASSVRTSRWSSPPPRRSRPPGACCCT